MKSRVLFCFTRCRVARSRGGLPSRAASLCWSGFFGTRASSLAGCRGVAGVCEGVPRSTNSLRCCSACNPTFGRSFPSAANIITTVYLKLYADKLTTEILLNLIKLYQ